MVFVKIPFSMYFLGILQNPCKSSVFLYKSFIPACFYGYFHEKLCKKPVFIVRLLGFIKSFGKTHLQNALNGFFAKEIISRRLGFYKRNICKYARGSRIVKKILVKSFHFAHFQSDFIGLQKPL